MEELEGQMGAEANLVVGTTATNEDLDAARNELLLVLLESADNALEGGSNVGKVGDTTTDDEDLALGTGSSAGNQVDDDLGVLVGLPLGWRTRVFTIVGKLVSES